jgi:hypothetical protein
MNTLALQSFADSLEKHATIESLMQENILAQAALGALTGGTTATLPARVRDLVSDMRGKGPRPHRIFSGKGALVGAAMLPSLMAIKKHLGEREVS